VWYIVDLSFKKYVRILRSLLRVIGRLSKFAPLQNTTVENLNSKHSCLKKDRKNMQTEVRCVCSFCSIHING